MTCSRLQYIFDRPFWRRHTAGWWLATEYHFGFDIRRRRNQELTEPGTTQESKHQLFVRTTNRLTRFQKPIPSNCWDQPTQVNTKLAKPPKNMPLHARPSLSALISPMSRPWNIDRHVKPADRGATGPTPAGPISSGPQGGAAQAVPAAWHDSGGRSNNFAVACTRPAALLGREWCNAERETEIHGFLLFLLVCQSGALVLQVVSLLARD